MPDGMKIKITIEITRHRTPNRNLSLTPKSSIGKFYLSAVALAKEEPQKNTQNAKILTGRTGLFSNMSGRSRGED
jgi:hypothetical protein